MSRRAPESLQETLSGSVAYVPAVLLADQRVSDSGVRLYALVRALGPGSDTYRGKDSLAEALGWSRRKLFRVAEALESAGWLERSTARKGSAWVSTWSVPKRSGVPLVAPSAISGSARNGTEVVPPMAPCRSATDGTREPTPKPKTNPRGEGLSSSIKKGKPPLDAKVLWACIPSWDRDHAPYGWEDLLDDLAAVLGRPALPRGTSTATLALAFVDRIRSRLPLNGVTSGEGLLIGAARGRSDADDALALRELLARAPVVAPSPTEPTGSESIPDEVLADLADSLSVASTRTRLRARSRPSNLQLDS